MNSTTDRVDVIEIAHKSGDRVRVSMPNNDVMVATSKAAAVACRAFADQISFKSQFDSLLEDLVEFVVSHEQSIQDAYVTPQESGIMFVVVQKQTEYDADFDDKIADLEWEISRDVGYSLIRFQGQLLPPSSTASLQSFLATEGTLRFGKPKSGE